MDSTDSDYALVEAEADRVAKQAALHLARSRAAARDPFQPTWTGSESRAAGIGLVPQKKRYVVSFMIVILNCLNATPFFSLFFIFTDFGN